MYISSKIRIAVVISIFSLLFFLTPNVIFASNTNGIVDVVSKHAWSENMGWINFRCDECDVQITDSAITGYAWSANYGWINLNPPGSGISNNGEGALSGSAWGENSGWINFSGVTIDSSGYFSGYASGTISGQVSFNCSNTDSCGSSDFKVRTDWRPQSSRPACNNSMDDDGDGLTDYPNDRGCESLNDTDEINVSTGRPAPLSTGSGVAHNFVGMGSTKSVPQVSTKGDNYLMYIDSKINFDISENGLNENSLNIKDLDMETGKIKFKFNSMLEEIELDVGELKYVDLDLDGIPDITVSYNELFVNRIDLTVTKLDLDRGPVEIDEEDFSGGELVKEILDSTVYLIKDNVKYPILNEQTFDKHNFLWDDIVEIDSLDRYSLGGMIGTVSPEAIDTSVYQFVRNLKVGDRGEDVKRLQQFLNQNGFVITESGPGSLGNETNFLGDLTRDSLIRFQNYYNNEILTPVGLTYGTGFFGPSTLKFLNAYLYQ